MEIVVGTTNPSKLGFFRSLLPEAVWLSAADAGIHAAPDESGRTPTENARLKAEFYGQYAECVICADSGLYFEGLSLDDPRQPGLHVRSPQGIRLDDEAMIRHYATLVHRLGGMVTAYYLDGFALWIRGRVYLFEATQAEARAAAFTMLDTPCKERKAGWPLDSLSVDRNGVSFLEPGRADMAQNGWPYRDRLRRFILSAMEEQREPI